MAEDNGNENENGQTGLRKFILPAAVSIAGAGAGLVLSNKSKLKESVPDFKEGVGDLATDLRSKLDSVLGKDDSSEQEQEQSSDEEQSQKSSPSNTYTPDEIAARRRERQERRDSRRAKS